MAVARRRAARDVARLAAGLLLALLLLAGGDAGAARAAEGELSGTLKKAHDSGVVTIGYRESSIPFSYLGEGRRPIGYAIDLCQEIVDDLARAVGRPSLQIVYKPVTSESRFAAMQAGETDLECGSTTANLERRRIADFSPVTFISATRLLVPKGSPVRSYRDLAGRKVVVTAGTTNEAAIEGLKTRLKIPLEIVTARDHAESFGKLKAGEADALALDDVLLYGLLASAGTERTAYVVRPDALSYEPYGIMFARNDPAMASVVNGTFRRLAETRELRWIYEKWFLKRLPNGERLGLPMSEELLGIYEMLGLPE